MFGDRNLGTTLMRIFCEVAFEKLPSEQRRTNEGNIDNVDSSKPNIKNLISGMN